MDCFVASAPRNDVESVRRSNQTNSTPALPAQSSRRVGKAQRAPIIFKKWWARHKCAFAHPPNSGHAIASLAATEQSTMTGQDFSDWLGLSGRVCVVTGGGGGIGRAVAVNLARAGAH